MKVRMIIGEYEEYDDGPPVSQAFLQTVAFPMEQPYLGDDADHPETVILKSEDDLAAWARRAFVSHDIWDMKVPKDAVVDPEDQDEVRRRELAEALVALSTAYDDPRGAVRDTLEHARSVVRAAWHEDDVTVDDYAVADQGLLKLIEAITHTGPTGNTG